MGSELIRTAVYSGSFNPLHIGHLAILGELVRLYDKVLLIVSPKNPLKDGIDRASAADRLAAAKAALGRHPELCEQSAVRGRVEICDIELHLPSPSYTINTLDALAKERPDEKLTLIMGADQIADIRRWKDYSRILFDYGAAVFPREGFDTASIRNELLAENPSYKIRLIEMPLVMVSSTQIREALKSGKSAEGLLM